MLMSDDDRDSGVWEAQHQRHIDLPPMALETEAAVLAFAMVDVENARRAVAALTPDHFASGQHQQIFQALSYLLAAGYTPTPPQVIDRITAIGRIGQVPRQFIADVVRWASVEGPIDSSLAQLDDLHRRRKFIRFCQESTAHGYIGETPITELLDTAQKAVVELASSSFRQALPTMTGPELAEELPELPWLVPALGIAPGAPVIVAGYGYSRKTMALQAMAVSVASGKPLWGVYQVRQGPVLHLDYEQGRRLTQERYQRLARGMGVCLAELPLQAACLPSMYLDGPGAEAMLVRACQGQALVIIDSLRAACPSADENSSDVRQHLDVLGRVSEKTGAVVVMVHHAKKPSKDEPEGAKFSIRGSASLFDACSGVFCFGGAKGEPTVVQHEKERNRGQTVEDFGINAEDVDNPVTGEANWGLRVVHLEAEQMAAIEPESDARADAAKAQRFAIACDRIISFLSTNPGASKRGVREQTVGAKDTVDAALEHLVRTGKVIDRGNKKGGLFYVE